MPTTSRHSASFKDRCLLSFVPSCDIVSVVYLAGHVIKNLIVLVKRSRDMASGVYLAGPVIESVLNPRFLV
jgi:hypothetical protein